MTVERTESAWRIILDLAPWRRHPQDYAHVCRDCLRIVVRTDGHRCQKGGHRG